MPDPRVQASQGGIFPGQDNSNQKLMKSKFEERKECPRECQGGTGEQQLCQGVSQEEEVGGQEREPVQETQHHQGGGQQEDQLVGDL